MTIVTNSNETLDATGSPGTWWTPGSGVTVVMADVDGNAKVVIESRRGSSDGAPKPLFFGAGATPVMQGPCRFPVQVMAGDDYRFRCIEGRTGVAASV